MVALCDENRGLQCTDITACLQERKGGGLNFHLLSIYGYFHVCFCYCTGG